MRISDWSSDVCSSDLPSRLSGPGAGIARHCDLSMENCKMTKLKLGPITEDKPVKVTIDLPGALHRDLVAYADALARENGQPTADPKRLIVPMLERFIATDRGFAKVRRAQR